MSRSRDRNTVLRSSSEADFCNRVTSFSKIASPDKHNWFLLSKNAERLPTVIQNCGCRCREVTKKCVTRNKVVAVLDLRLISGARLPVDIGHY